MPIKATIPAIEQSTYVVTLTFKDEDGNSVSPNSIKWTLTDSAGNVINSRQDVSISPASSVSIVLRGDDLALQASESDVGQRILTVEATYDSDKGSNLPLKDELSFYVVNLTNVS